MAVERFARDAAADDLRFLRSLTALAGLLLGGKSGESHYAKLEAHLEEQLTGRKQATPAPAQTAARRRKLKTGIKD